MTGEGEPSAPWSSGRSSSVRLVVLATVTFLGSQALSRSARQEADRLRVLRQLGTSRTPSAWLGGDAA